MKQIVGFYLFKKKNKKKHDFNSFVMYNVTLKGLVWYFRLEALF